MPRISVVMGTKNDAPYLRASIDSILKQTFTDFEFIIVNDGSTDDTADILARYTDSRLKVITHQQSIRLAKALNAGLEIAQGELIARMDGDDIALPDRLQKQVDFMDANPKTGILGTQTKFMKRGRVLAAKKHYPTQHSLIVWYLMMSDALVHPTLMLRRQVIETRQPFYDTRFTIGQDTATWLQLIESGVCFANLSESLLIRRLHKRSTTISKQAQDREKVNEFRAQQFRHWSGSDTATVRNIYRMNAYYLRGQLLSSQEAQELCGLLINLFHGLQAADHFLPDEIDIVRQDMLMRIEEIMQHSPNGMRYLGKALLTYADTFLPVQLQKIWRAYIQKKI